MAIPSKAQRDQWRADAANGMTAALGEYAPAEFVYLLDALDELEQQRDALLAAAKGALKPYTDYLTCGEGPRQFIPSRERLREAVAKAEGE